MVNLEVLHYPLQCSHYMKLAAIVISLRTSYQWIELCITTFSFKCKIDFMFFDYFFWEIPCSSGNFLKIDADIGIGVIVFNRKYIFPFIMNLTSIKQLELIIYNYSFVYILPLVIYELIEYCED
jgi:hypothetical protein